MAVAILEEEIQEVLAVALLKEEELQQELEMPEDILLQKVIMVLEDQE